jgi:FAD:protein FMN transferase
LHLMISARRQVQKTGLSEKLYDRGVVLARAVSRFLICCCCSSEFIRSNKGTEVPTASVNMLKGGIWSATQVIPAKAGIQEGMWIPAFAGMTIISLSCFLFKFLFIIFVCTLLSGCGAPQPEETTFEGPVMGTYYRVKVVTEPGLQGQRREEIHTAVREELEQINRQMSTYRPDSEVSRLNEFKSSKEVFPLPDKVLEVLRISQRVSEKTEGAFDVTVGPLVNAWGFGPAGQAATAEDDTIEKILADVGYQQLQIEENGVLKLNPEVRVDFSAVAKGYGVDQVARVLDSSGVEHYLVEIGGEIRTRGLNRKGKPWVIGIEKPQPDFQGIYRVVALRNQSMATSGDYRNFRDRDGGRRIIHIIDPRSGLTVQNRIASVSVVHEECAVADAYATGLMVLGAEAGMAVAERENLAVFMILRTESGDFEQRESTAFQAGVEGP